MKIWDKEFAIQVLRPAPLIITAPARTYGPDRYVISDKYGKAIDKAGGVLLTLNSVSSDAQFERICDSMEGLLLPGGEDVEPSRYGEKRQPYCQETDKLRDEMEFQLLEIALQKQVPILGICRGMQLLNVYFGGTLYQDIDTQFQTSTKHDNHDNPDRDFIAHRTVTRSSSRLYKITKRDQLSVNSLHHQGIKDLAPGLVATAWSEDGLIEAIEHPDYPFLLGTQWHPEELIRHNYWLKLFESFIIEAKIKSAANALEADDYGALEPDWSLRELAWAYVKNSIK